MIENQHAALANFRMEKAARNLKVARQNYQLGQFEEAEKFLKRADELLVNMLAGKDGK
jgi:hypothetical protein